MNGLTPIQKKLFEMQDLIYRDFQSRLMPTVKKDCIIGVRTPLLRKYAAEISGTKEAEVFLKSLPHKYYEENNLHAFLIEKEKNYDKVIELLDEFLPYVDNWATCDSMKPGVIKKHLYELPVKINEWICSKETYKCRFGLEMIMNFYLDDFFDVRYLELASQVKSDEYYIRMMIAWLFATALSKQYEQTVKFIEEKRLDKWTHNKTIQKAKESLRITKEQKQYLNGLKLK